MTQLFTLHTTTTFTDAQIKALPTTPVSAVPTPGVGKILVPLSVTWLANFQVAYTNVDPTAALHIVFAGDTASRFGPGYFLAEDSLWRHGDVGYLKRGRLGEQASSDLGLALAGFDDTALNAKMVNAALGNLTGGHANNTLTAVTRYLLVDLPHVLRLVSTQWVLDDDPSGASPDGFGLTSDSGLTFKIDTTLERGLAFTTASTVPEVLYP